MVSYFGSGVAEWVRCLLCKSEDLSSIPRSHGKVEGETRVHVIVPQPAHTHYTQACTHCPMSYIQLLEVLIVWVRFNVKITHILNETHLYI